MIKDLSMEIISERKKRFRKYNIVITWFFMFFMNNILFSQGFYVKAGAGYNLGFPQATLGDNYSIEDYSSNYIVTDKSIQGTFAEGVRFDGAIGYLWKTFGFEIGVSSMPKSNLEMTSIYKYTPSSTYEEVSNYKPSLLTFTPSIVFITDIGIYGRAGIIIGFPAMDYTYKYTNSYSNTTLNTTSEIQSTFSGDMALGFSGAIGWMIGSGNIKFYIEAEMDQLNWAPTRIEATAYTVNGVDHLSMLTTSQRICNYVDSFTYNSAASPSSEPSTAGKFYMPFNSLGLKAGVMIGF